MWARDAVSTTVARDTPGHITTELLDVLAVRGSMTIPELATYYYHNEQPSRAAFARVRDAVVRLQSLDLIRIVPAKDGSSPGRVELT